MATVYTYTRKPSLIHSYCSNYDDVCMMSLYSYCFTSLSSFYLNLLTSPLFYRGEGFGASLLSFAKMQSVSFKKIADDTSDCAIVVTQLDELYDFYDFL